MRIIISPAKKMNVDLHSPFQPTTPGFLAETTQILEVLQAMDGAQLQSLWKCNDALAKLNQERIQTLSLTGDLTPALFSYEGIQYRYMAPHVLEGGQIDYLQTHLRILSGFYGVLRPLDGVSPYRLEMQAKLALSPHKNLYQFWGSKLADVIAQEGSWVLNLASHEYSRSVLPHLPASMAVVTCTFGQRKEGKIVEAGTLCKMARGDMVRYLAEHNVTTPEGVQGFQGLDFRFSPEESTDTQFVFLK